MYLYINLVKIDYLKPTFELYYPMPVVQPKILDNYVNKFPLDINDFFRCFPYNVSQN